MRVIENGRPMPESDFDMHTMSGSIPARSNENSGPVRPKPAWMSSTISRMS